MDTPQRYWSWGIDIDGARRISGTPSNVYFHRPSDIEFLPMLWRKGYALITPSENFYCQLAQMILIKNLSIDAEYRILSLRAMSLSEIARVFHEEGEAGTPWCRPRGAHLADI